MKHFFIALLILWSSSSMATMRASLSGCTKEADVSDYDYFGELHLIERFLPSDNKEREQFYALAAERQIRHLIGFFRNAHTQMIGQSLAPKITSFKKLSLQQTSLKHNFILHDLGLEREITEENTYFQNIKSQKLEANEKIIQIKFSAMITIADCLGWSTNWAKSILLPLDPFLSFWTEDPKHFTEQKFKDQSRKISNCLIPEIINFGNNSQNWFFWNPLSGSRINSSVTRKCNYKMGQNVYTPRLTKRTRFDDLKPQEAFFADFKNRSLQIYSFFGINSTSSSFLEADYQKIFEQLRNTMNLCQSKSTPDCLTQYIEILKPDESGKYFEPGLYYFVIYLHELHKLVEKLSITVSKSHSNKNEIILSLSGVLRKSQSKINFELYFGPTSLDYGPPPSENYARLTRDALATADVLSYFGHSGLGENFKLKSLQKMWQSHRLAKPNRSHPLWVGFFSCEGYSYFGSDLHAVFKEDTAPQLLISSSTGILVEARFPASQIFSLDLWLQSGQLPVTEAFSKYARPSDFYVHTEHHPRP